MLASHSHSLGLGLGLGGGPGEGAGNNVGDHGQQQQQPPQQQQQQQQQQQPAFVIDRSLLQAVLHKLKSQCLPELEVFYEECVKLKTKLGLDEKKELQSSEIRLVQFINIVATAIQQIHGYTSTDVPVHVAKAMVTLEMKIARTIMPVKTRLFSILNDSRLNYTVSGRSDDLSSRPKTERGYKRNVSDSRSTDGGLSAAHLSNYGHHAMNMSMNMNMGPSSPQAMYTGLPMSYMPMSMGMPMGMPALQQQQQQQSIHRSGSEDGFTECEHLSTASSHGSSSNPVNNHHSNNCISSVGSTVTAGFGSTSDLTSMSHNTSPVTIPRNNSNNNPTSTNNNNNSDRAMSFDSSNDSTSSAPSESPDSEFASDQSSQPLYAKRLRIGTDNNHYNDDSNNNCNSTNYAYVGSPYQQYQSHLFYPPQATNSQYNNSNSNNCNNSNINNTTNAIAYPCTAECDEYVSSRLRKRLSAIVPFPRKPRDAEYSCSVCGSVYQCVVHDNPWWAVYHHECPHCLVCQVPRIDISLPANAIEIDPNVGALYGDGIDDNSLLGDFSDSDFESEYEEVEGGGDEEEGEDEGQDGEEEEYVEVESEGYRNSQAHNSRNSSEQESIRYPVSQDSRQAMSSGALMQQMSLPVPVSSLSYGDALNYLPSFSPTSSSSSLASPSSSSSNTFLAAMQFTNTHGDVSSSSSSNTGTLEGIPVVTATGLYGDHATNTSLLTDCDPAANSSCDDLCDASCEERYFDGEGLLSQDEASKLLVLMAHARTCAGYHASPEHEEICRSTKFMMLHLRDCNGRKGYNACSNANSVVSTMNSAVVNNSCNVVNGCNMTNSPVELINGIGKDCCRMQWCAPCKKMLKHLTRCADPASCPVCNPWTLPEAYHQLRGLNMSSLSHMQMQQMQQMQQSSQQQQQTQQTAMMSH